MSNFEKVADKTAAIAGNTLATYLVAKTVYDVFAERREAKIQKEQAKRQALESALLLRITAFESGKPDDKIAALEAANSADKALGRRQLGPEILGGFISQYLDECISPSVYNLDPKKVWPARTASWANPHFTRYYVAIGEAMGNQAGITLFKPVTYEDYLAAADQINASQERTANAHWAQSRGNSVLMKDFSVPGTAFQAGAAQALAWNTE
jgi:hypothetical protein